MTSYNIITAVRNAAVSPLTKIIINKVVCGCRLKSENPIANHSLRFAVFASRELEKMADVREPPPLFEDDLDSKELETDDDIFQIDKQV